MRPFAIKCQRQSEEDDKTKVRMKKIRLLLLFCDKRFRVWDLLILLFIDVLLLLSLLLS